MNHKIEDRSAWTIGVSLLDGPGAGSFFLRKSALAFVASIILGFRPGFIYHFLLSGQRS